MNVTNSKLIISAIAMSFAASAGMALADEPVTTTSATMNAKMDARTDAKHDALENKADMKKDTVDAMDSSQPGTDSWITTKVKAELASTANVSSMKISVDTVDGVVFLTGVVDSADNAAKAAAAAKTVKGVKKVDSTGLKSM